MTEKRFTQRLYETGERFLEDNETDCFYKIEDSFGNVELLCERLNKIVDENEQLKSFVEYEKRQHKHWKRECLENIKEIAQLKREIVQLKGDVE